MTDGDVMRIAVGANVLPDSGGVAEHLDRLSRHLSALGADVVQVHHEEWMSGRGLLSTYQFSKYFESVVRSSRAVVAHAHGSDGFTLGPGPLRVMTSHGDERLAWRVRQETELVPFRSKILVPTTRLAVWKSSVLRADLVVALHEGEARRFRQERAGRPVVVVENGADEATSAATPEQGRLLFLGSWIGRKGSADLPAIFNKIRQGSPRTKLVLAGPPMSALSAFDAEDRANVTALGQVPRGRLSGLLATADVLLLPSHFEGLPLAVLEAAAHGVPTVAYVCEGSIAAIAGGGMITLRDVASYADAVIAVVENRLLRQQLGQRALGNARRRSWDNMARETLMAYEVGLSAVRANGFGYRP